MTPSPGEAAVGLATIRGQLNEIGPDPLVSLLEVVARPGFGCDVRPSILRTKMSRCLGRWEEACWGIERKSLSRESHPYTVSLTAWRVGNLVRARREPVTIAQYDGRVLLRPSTPPSVWSRNKLSRFRPGLSAIIAACPERNPNGNGCKFFEKDVELLWARAVRDKEHRIPVDHLLAFLIAGDSPGLSPTAIGIFGEPAQIV